MEAARGDAVWKESGGHPRLAPRNPPASMKRASSGLAPRNHTPRRRGVVDSEEVSRWLAHNSTSLHVDLLNFRVRDENG